MRSSILAILGVVAVVMAGCVERTGSEAFGTPEIVSAEAVVLGVREARLSATLSEPRAERCGFVYGVAGAPPSTAECRLTGSSFELELEGLTPGATYEWYAFAAAGESEVRSQAARFTLESLPPEEKAVIPDPVFKEYLTSHFDKDGDGEISLSEARALRKIAVKTVDIFSLKGIEYFTNLDTLICRGVNLDSDEYTYEGFPGRLRDLDLTSNTRLRIVECDGNNIESLSLPESPWLEILRCSKNRLSDLDISMVPNLRRLQAFSNRLTLIDFSNNHDIEHIEIDTNPIGSIDVSCCPRLGLLNISDSDLQTLDVSQNPNLGWLSVSGTGVSSLDLSVTSKLHYLYCSGTKISSLDLSHCTLLNVLSCRSCLIEELDISMLPNLELVECAPMNTLKKLYVSDSQVIEGVTRNRSEANVPAETEIVIRYVGAPDGKISFEDPCFKAYLVSAFDRNRDGEISLEEASEIYKIHICSDELNITSLQGIEFMPNLEFLCCSGTWISTTVLNRPNYYLSKHYHWDDCIGPIGTLKKVDVTHNHKLRVLDLSNNSGIGETDSGTVDVSNCPELEELYLQMCYIKYPDVSACTKLQILNMSHGHGDFPDFSDNSKLLLLDLGHEQRSRQQPIDISHCPLLEEIDLSASASSLSDLSYNPKLRVLKLNWCMRVDPDLSALPLLEVFESQGNGLTSLDLSAQRNLVTLNVSGNPLGSLDLSGLKGLRRLMCNSCGLLSLDLSVLRDLEYIECYGNNLASLDLSGNLKLKEVYCQYNPILSLDLSNNTSLTHLYCSETGIKTLDVSHNRALCDLRCNDNDLDRIDVSSNPELIYLYFERCRIESVDLSGNPRLQEIDCSGNGMKALDVSGNPQLRWLVCGNNLIGSLDVSKNPRLGGTNGDDLTGLYCAPMNDSKGKNILKSLYLSSGQSIAGVTVNRSTKHVPEETELIII